MIVGGEPEAQRRAQPHRIADKRTAANEPVVAVASDPGRAVVRCAVVIGMQTILDPLPDVAVHVVEAERVGRKRADRRGLAAVKIAAAAVAVGVVFAELVAPRIGRRRAGARRILPFGFGEQPVGAGRSFWRATPRTAGRAPT